MSAKNMLKVTIQLEVETRKAQACFFREEREGARNHVLISNRKHDIDDHLP